MRQILFLASLFPLITSQEPNCDQYRSDNFQLLDEIKQKDAQIRDL